MGIYNILKDFVTPVSTVAITLVVGYFITRHVNSQKEERELNSKRITLIDTILLEVGRLNSIFEILRVDAEQNMFMLKNTEAAKPSVAKLQEIFAEVTVLPDENIRKRILVDIDLVESLIRDIVNIENFALLEINKFTANEAESLKELRNLKLTLLRKDIGFDVSMEPILLRANMTALTDEKLKAIKASYHDLDLSYINAKNALNQSNLICKDKRVFYCMRIIDVQAKLRELEFILNAERDKYTSSI